MDNTQNIIHVEFDGVGSVNFKQFVMNNVSPLQVIALANYLEVTAKSELVAQLAMAKEQIDKSKLIVPEPKISFPDGSTR